MLKFFIIIFMLKIIEILIKFLVHFQAFGIMKSSCYYSKSDSPLLSPCKPRTDEDGIKIREIQKRAIARNCAQNILCAQQILCHFITSASLILSFLS